MTPGPDIAERSRIWQALLESEDRYRATFNYAPIGIMHTSVDADRILHANPKLSEMLGYTENELLSMTTDDIVHPDHSGSDRPRYREKMLSGQLDSYSSERKYLRKDGSAIWVNRTVSLARDKLGEPLYFIRIVEDITGRKQTEASLARLMRARRVMGKCNHVLVHAVGETAMLEEMCSVVAESGGYKMAWVGIATGDPARPVEPVAYAGFRGDAPMSASAAWSADGRYQGFMHEVITTGQPHIARNILGDPALARRRDRAMQHGFQSSIALPLRNEGGILGAIAIYASEPDAFDTDEISLLSGLADDIAFGIVSLRTRVAREEAEARSRETERRFQETFEQAAVGLTRVDLNGVLVDFNQKFCDMLGYSREGLLGKTIRDITHPGDYGQGAQFRAQLVDGVARSQAGEKRFVRSDGTVLWARRTMSTACDAAGRPQFIISVVEDITERKAAEDRYRTTFDDAPVGIMHTRIEDDRILHVNPRLCEMVGYSHDELLGMVTDDLIPAELSGMDRGKYREKMLSGELKTFYSERKFLRKDGSRFWVNRTVSLARDAAGRPLYFIRIVEDITERKEAERQFQETFDQAAVGIGHVGFDGNYIRVNRKFREIVGYSEQELIGSSSGMVSHPDDIGSGNRARKQLLAGEIGSYANEKRYLRKDGATIWVNRTESIARDEAGKPLYFIRVIEDITRRKAVEDERARLSMIVENASDAIIGCTLDGAITSWNAAAERMFGHSESEVVGQAIGILVPEQHRHLAENHEKLRRGEVIPASESVRVTRDGRVIQVQSGISPIRNDAGEVIGAAVIMRDITERKNAEEAIARERALLRAIIDTVPDFIYVKDAEGRFQLANRAWLRERNLGETAIAGKTVFELFPAYLAERMAAQDAQVVKSGVPIRDLEQKVVVKTPEGVVARPRWFSITKVPMQDASGKITGTVGTSRDITERKLLEQSREAEHAVTRALAEAASVDEAMPKLIRTVCKAMGWSYGAYWKWNETEQTLVRNEHWSDFVMDCSGEELVPWTRLRYRSPGGPVTRAWFEKQVTWVEDVRRDERFNRRHTALKFGLHSAFVFPVIAGSDSIGIMEFLGRDVRRPDETLLQVAGSIGRQIGQFMQRKEAEQALRRSEERYRDVFEASPLPMWVWDDETLDILAVNQAAIDHYGYSREEFLRLNVRDIWAPDDAPRYEQNILDRARQQTLQLQRRHRTKSGRVIDTEVTARVFSLGGRTVWLTLSNDVSVRLRAEAALRESEEQFRQLSGNIPQVFWITDTSHRQTLYVSPAAETMLGRPLPDILADRRALIRAVHKEDRARVYAARRTAVESGYDETYRILRPDGSIRWVHDRAFPVRDGDGRIYRIAGIAEDVTDRKQAEERLERLAHYDILTNLPNRALFYDRLKQALAQAKRNRWTMGVMFIDADRFKNVNDTLGHAVGDKLLQQIAGRLTRSVRAGDTVGRLGGDEFAIVLSTLASAQDATLVAQKIMAAFNEPFRLEGTDVYVTASIGITLYPDDSSDQDVLIKSADTAMYRAKETGRNCYQFYTPEMHARAIELLGMESSLRRALERDEFLLYYQPKVSVADGDMTGVEALLRWKHPERGIVSPAEFIPLLEESGLIVPVGEWVLKAVCSQIKAWERAGARLVPVAVNLSARQFTAKDLGPTIKRILEEHQVDPALIELEITESSLMANTEEAALTLEYLDQLGVSLSIDDFGTGYSSLGYLKRFPLSALKIDRSFVRDVTTDGDDATITRAVISMAHSLGLKVIAEGVETQAQLEFLAEYGCNEIQGYYFARPLAAEDCSAWIMERRRLERERPASDAGVPVVLLVDDDDDALVRVERTLARDGYRILAARDAREGFALLRDHRVDVVVSDQNMPGMSGVDFLQSVQTLSPKTMRILSTSYADFQTMADAVNKGGIFRCLPKDMGEDALRISVREAMQAKIREMENSIPPGTLRK